MTETEGSDLILDGVQAAFDEVMPDARRTLTRQDALLDLGVSSVAAFEMAGLLQDRFDVRFPEDELFQLRTVGDFTALIERLKA